MTPNSTAEWSGIFETHIDFETSLHSDIQSG